MIHFHNYTCIFKIEQLPNIFTCMQITHYLTNFSFKQKYYIEI